MEQLYFDTNIYGTAEVFQHTQQLQPAFQYQEDTTYEFNNALPEIAPVDLEANQEFLNLLFLQNQIIQAQQIEPESALITPTEEFFSQHQKLFEHFESEPIWLNNNSNFDELNISHHSDELRLPLTPDQSFEIKSPFLINSNIQQSTLLKSRSKTDSHKSLNEVANYSITRSRSAGGSYNPFYVPTEYSRRTVSPLKREAKLSEEELTKLQRSANVSKAATPKVNNNFIREYNNKKISKFIKGTKKTNKGYKNFINYKCTGDNFERDEKAKKEL